MQLINILAALTASAALVAAGPVNARACPNGWDYCGECNGTSCKIAGINYDCKTGSCTAQSGGGDGKLCGGSNAYGQPTCPGKA